jgi:hypothetical protein
MHFKSVSCGGCHCAPSRPCIVALAGFFLSLLAGPAMSLPPNPERPNHSTICAEAQSRLREAELGSPLVSRHENAEFLEQARAVVARLCTDPIDPPCPEDGAPTHSSQ